jgi:hypothetical protein
MRDDFTEEVKRTLAARVAYLCSNPDCRAPTSGPQIDATKALNVGVAAHITSAAEGGPRYNSLLSPEERRHPDNGIWLCQNCAKLIDNDTSRYTEKLIRAWKEIAEDHALGLIGKTATRETNVVPESESQRKLRAILPWMGKTVKLSQMTTGKAVYMVGPVMGSSFPQLLDCTEFYVTVGTSGSDAWKRSISLANIEISFDNERRCLELQEYHR